MGLIAVGEKVVQGRVDPHPAAISALHANAEHLHSRRGHCGNPPFDYTRLVVGMDHFEGRITQHLALGQPEHLQVRLIALEDVALLVLLAPAEAGCCRHGIDHRNTVVLDAAFSGRPDDAQNDAVGASKVEHAHHSPLPGIAAQARSCFRDSFALEANPRVDQCHAVLRDSHIDAGATIRREDRISL